MQNGAAPRAAEMRALLIHTAFSKGALGQPTPKFGHGVPSIEQAYQILASTFEQGVQRLAIGRIATSQEQEFTVAVEEGRVLWVVTLAWTDPAGEVNAGDKNDPTPALVHDLDVVVTHESGEVFYPWSLQVGDGEVTAVKDQPNRRDNVERIVVEEPIPGPTPFRFGWRGNYWERRLRSSRWCRPTGSQQSRRSPGCCKCLERFWFPWIRWSKSRFLDPGYLGREPIRCGGGLGLGGMGLSPRDLDSPSSLQGHADGQTGRIETQGWESAGHVVAFPLGRRLSPKTLLGGGSAG